MESLEKLLSSNIRVVKGKEIPHPEEIINLMKKFGDIKVAKLSGKVEGLDDDFNEIQLVNNYLVEVSTDNSEFYGTIGVLVQQGSDKLKVYSGLTASACLNLSIFGADYIRPLKSIDLDILNSLLDKGANSLVAQTDLVKSIVNKLQNQIYSEETWQHTKGRLLNTMPTHLLPYLMWAEEQLRDNPLYNRELLSSWLLLSAMTDKIKNESISSRISKTIELEDLFK